jgi:uncharacterized OB-fold protein
MSTASDNSESALERAQYARCSVCDEAYFPLHTLTPCGHSAPPSLHSFTEPGEVYAWTRSHGSGGAVLIAMADFLDGDIRVTAPVPGVDAIAVGDHLTVLTSEDGSFILAQDRDGH